MRSSAAHAPWSSAQAITVGPDPDSVAPAHPAGRLARIDVEHVRRTVRLVEPVAERCREEGCVAARSARTEERGTSRAGGRVCVWDSRGQSLPRGSGRRAPGRDDGDGIERKPLCDAGDPSLPGERQPAHQRCGEVVGVWLERETCCEQLLGGCAGGRRHEAERDRRGRRAESSFEWDAIHEPEALAGRVGEQRVGADGEIRRVGGELRAAFALDHDTGAVADVELVPELERHRRRIEPGSDVGRRGGSANRHSRAAAAIESASASTCRSGGA